MDLRIAPAAAPGAAGGAFRVTGLPAGSYTVNFSLGENSQEAQVTVETGRTTRLDQTVDWDLNYDEG